MKKLVTLSSIALAGATLGVGTTFGWWADDADAERGKLAPKSVEQPPKEPAIKDAVLQDALVKEAAAKDASAKETPPGEQNDILIRNVKGFEVRVVEPSSPPAAADVKLAAPTIDRIYTGMAPLPSSRLEKLVDELEGEAKEMEGHGQPEAAAVQRKVADRLREFLKANQKPKQRVTFLTPELKSVDPAQNEKRKLEYMNAPAAHPAPHAEAPRNVIVERREPVMINGRKVYTSVFGVVEAPPAKEAVAETRPPAEAGPSQQIEREIGKRIAILTEVNDEGAKRQLEAEVQALKAQLKAILAARDALNHSDARVREKEAKAKAEGREWLSRRHTLLKEFPTIAKELHEVAEQLERTGHKEQAQAVRKQIERLGSESGAGRVTITLNQDAQTEKEHLDGKLLQRLRAHDEHLADLIRKEQHAEKARAEARHRQAAEEPRDHGPEHAQPMAQHLGEMHRMLHELRHEIGALREEVRDLRGLLKSERAGQKKHEEEAGKSGHKDSEHDEYKEHKNKEGRDKNREESKPGKQADGQRKPKQVEYKSDTSEDREHPPKDKSEDRPEEDEEQDDDEQDDDDESADRQEVEIDTVQPSDAD